MWGMVKLFGALREDEDSDNFSSPYSPSPLVHSVARNYTSKLLPGDLFPLG